MQQLPGGHGQSGGPGARWPREAGMKLAEAVARGQQLRAPWGPLARSPEPQSGVLAANSEARHSAQPQAGEGRVREPRARRHRNGGPRARSNGPTPAGLARFAPALAWWRAFGTERAPAVGGDRPGLQGLAQHRPPGAGASITSACESASPCHEDPTRRQRGGSNLDSPGRGAGLREGGGAGERGC